MTTRPKPRDWRQFEKQRPRWTNILWMIVFAPMVVFCVLWLGFAVLDIGKLLFRAWGAS